MRSGTCTQIGIYAIKYVLCFILSKLTHTYTCIAKVQYYRIACYEYQDFIVEGFHKADFMRHNLYIVETCSLFFFVH